MINIDVEDFIKFVKISPDSALNYFKDLEEPMYYLDMVHFSDDLSNALTTLSDEQKAQLVETYTDKELAQDSYYLFTDFGLSDDTRVRLNEVLNIINNYLDYAYNSQSKSKDLKVFSFSSYLSELDGQEKQKMYVQQGIDVLANMLLSNPENAAEIIFQNAEMLESNGLKQLCKKLNTTVRNARAYGSAPEKYEALTDMLLRIYDYIDYAQEAYEKEIKVFGFKNYLLEDQEQFSTILKQKEAELSSLEEEEKTITAAETLIARQTEKEGQNIGE